MLGSWRRFGAICMASFDRTAVSAGIRREGLLSIPPVQSIAQRGLAFDVRPNALQATREDARA